MAAFRELIWSTVCSQRLATAALVATLYVFFPVAALAISPTYEGQRIAAIRFDPAEQPLDPHDLESKTAALKTGTPLRMANVRQVISDLYRSGRYTDIAVDASPEDGGIAITFVTKVTQFVRDVVVEGVPEPPNQSQLISATKLDLGAPFSPSQLKQASESVLYALRSEGFYNARVNTQAEPAEHQQVDLLFDVNAGKRARFSEPILKGHPERELDDIVKATRWKRLFGINGWRDMTQARVMKGLDRIRQSYQKKDYLRAKVTLDQMEYHESTNRVTPVLDIDGGPKIVVTATGAKISRGKMKQLVPVYEEGAVDTDLLVEGQHNIQEYLQSKGYFESTVDFATGSQVNEEDVQYDIDTGPRHKFVHLEITGNKYFDTPSIRERMYLEPASLLRFHWGRYSEQYVRRDVQSIKDLYKANGFRDVDVKVRTEDDYKGHDNDIGVFITINEGTQWFVDNLDITGVDDKEKSDILAMIRSSPGQPYSAVNIAGDQDTIVNYFFDRGFPNTTFEASAKQSAEPTRMDLRYVINRGQRQYVREVLVSGTQTTKASLVSDRIRDLDPGDPLSLDAVNASQRRLYDLGVFASVDTAIQNPEGDDRYKYVLFRLQEAHRYHITGGVGAQIGRIGRGDINSLDTPAGATGFSPRVSFGITRTNFLGLGHTVGLQTRYSNVEKRALVSYIAPQFEGKENLSITTTGLFYQSLDVTTFAARRLEGTIQLSQRLTKANTIQYRLTYRRVSVSDLKITPALIPLLSRPVQLGIASTSFIQDRRDDPTDAHRGIYNTVDVGIASSLIGSKTSFGRLLATNATYHPITRTLTFARQTQFGFIEKISAGDIPLAERFFAGGATTHRGFGENQAGPRDTGSGVVINGTEFTGTGFPIGGNALFINSLEMRFPLFGDSIGGVLFHDAGNVYSRLGAISFSPNQKDIKDFDYMVHAVGFGIRYKTPIGPMRIDLAVAINPPEFYGLKGSLTDLENPALPNVQFVKQQLSHFQFHFSLGQAF